jgi:hypothetical protein
MVQFNDPLDHGQAHPHPLPTSGGAAPKWSKHFIALCGWDAGPIIKN